MRVYLDAGHGGQDSGCTPDGFNEAEWVLEVELRSIADLATTGWPLELACSRNDEASCPTLAQRAQRALAFGADFSMALHVNATSDPREHGALGFRIFGAPLAQDVLDATIRSMQRPGEYVDSAGQVRPMTRQITSAKAIGEDGLPHWTRRAFNVLQFYGTRPACLVEFDYASHPASRAWLLSNEGRDRAVSSIRAGIRRALILRGELVEDSRP